MMVESSFRSNLVRLNANGTLDTAFDPNPNSTVSAVALRGARAAPCAGMSRLPPIGSVC